MIKNSAILIYFLVALLPAALSSRKTLCPDPEHSYIVGLVIDEDAYSTYKGGPIPTSDNPDEIQEWALVQKERRNDKQPNGAFGNKFLQVSPDIGRKYPDAGLILDNPKQLEGMSPYVAFNIRVDEEGWHTLFLRWTAGDTVGTGDSLFVALKDTDKDKYVPGQFTIKPTMKPISDLPYEGCCYDKVTRACSCDITKIKCNGNKEYFDKAKASDLDIQCPIGSGAMTFVNDPLWYLFSGRGVNSDKEDFGTEPWDTTCEAQGDNTADSGKDSASWYLSKGQEYELRIFAREDGTALDAIYIVGPGGDAPLPYRQFNANQSTFCDSEKNKDKKAGIGRILVVFSSILAISAILGVFLIKTTAGSSIFHRVRMMFKKTPVNDLEDSSMGYLPIQTNNIQ